MTLQVLGVELALAFGFFAFLLNFIPTLGSVISTVLPLPVVLMNPEISITVAVLAIVIPGSIHFLIGTWSEPLVIGDSLELHPVTVLVSLMVWGTLWGAVGMLLATPITAVLSILSNQAENDTTLGAPARRFARDLPERLEARGEREDLRRHVRPARSTCRLWVVPGISTPRPSGRRSTKARWSPFERMVEASPRTTKVGIGTRPHVLGEGLERVVGSVVRLEATPVETRQKATVSARLEALEGNLLEDVVGHLVRGGVGLKAAHRTLHRRVAKLRHAAEALARAHQGRRSWIEGGVQDDEAAKRDLSPQGEMDREKASLRMSPPTATARGSSARATRSASSRSCDQP